jgi:hypothetical protein
VANFNIFQCFYESAGGIFALYSLICRNAKVNLIPNQQVNSEKRMSSFLLKLPTPELERSIKVKERLESSLLLKKMLLGLVLFATDMFISNGVITPAMSGLFLFHFLLIVSDFQIVLIVYVSYIAIQCMLCAFLFDTIITYSPYVFFCSLAIIITLECSVVCCQWLESWDAKCLTR